MRHPPLCFGGSFNPIHFGHLRCAQAAAIARGFDEVVFIPNAQPPHKPPSADFAPAQDRLAMARLAISTADPPPLFTADDLELRRSGPSYTIDTVTELLSRGWPEVWWLIGADMLNYLPQWHRADDLVRQCHFLILQRPGVPLNWDALPAEMVTRLKDNVVPAPLVDTSSTVIRRRVRAGESIEGMTPEVVADYIASHRLYC